MARDPINAAREQGGFSVVEILVALLLLAVISAGIGMAFVGSSKLQGTARVNGGMNAAAQRVVEYLRSHRSWMDTCRTVTSCDLSKVIPSGDLNDLLKDDSMGESVCPGAAGTYHHKLGLAQAQPVDSATDGVGASDRDQIRADYFSLTVKVTLQCTADYARLFQRTLSSGQALPSAVIETTIDPRGNVAKGTLVVEVCRTTNQRDERMAITGCRTGAGQGLKMMNCPPQNAVLNATPAEGCDRSWNWISGTFDTATDPSAFVHIQRAQASFKLNSTASNTTLTSSDAGVDQRNGTYVFQNIDAGVWELAITTPPASSGVPLEVWKLKVIPTQQAATSSQNQVTGQPDVIQVTVQPDVTSRALIPFTQSTTNSNANFRIRFKRRVVTRNVVSKHIPMAIVDTAIPTAGYEGDLAYLEAQTINFCNVQAARGGYPCQYIRYVPAGPHCITGGYRMLPPGQAPITRYFTSCTRYHLWADADYWEVALPGTSADYDGPAVNAHYGVAAAPTFRDLMAPAPNCSDPTAPGTGVMNPYMVFGCVTANYPGATLAGVPTMITIGPLSTGLNTGLWTENGAASYSSLDDRAANHSALRNEEVQTLPAAIRSGLWIRPTDRRIITQAGPTYPNGQIFDVIGKGECRWRENGGAPHIGSCDDCEPYIVSAGGQVNGCYILVQVCYKRYVYYTTDVPFLQEAPRTEDGCVDQRQTCYGAPFIGTDPTYIATNCKAVPTKSVPPIAKPIPPKVVKDTNFTIHLPSTAVGDS